MASTWDQATKFQKVALTPGALTDGMQRATTWILQVVQIANVLVMPGNARW